MGTKVWWKRRALEKKCNDRAGAYLIMAVKFADQCGSFLNIEMNEIAENRNWHRTQRYRISLQPTFPVPYYELSTWIFKVKKIMKIFTHIKF